MKVRLKTISLLTAIILLVTGMCFSVKTFAYEVEEAKLIGIVETKNTDLNVRSGPGTEYEKIGSISKGTVIEVTGITADLNEAKWYRVSANGITGFVSESYVRIIEIPEEPDEAFELLISNFPESYKDQLRLLHAIHPTWKFTPLMTGLTWETLMKNQTVLGRNLLQSPSGWKSFRDGAYDWVNKAWYSFDSGNWVQALDEVIAYYLDPRNFLDGNIYQFLVLSDDGSEYDPKVINEILKGTFMYDAECGEYATYGEAIVKAAKEAGASPYMLAARIRMEQGSKGNKLAHGTVEGYEGYFNHFDIGAWAHSGNSAILNGAIYAKKKGWDSRYKAILGGAQFLVKNYIGVGQNTLYLQKYDVVDGGNGLYGHQYMTNVSAAVSECHTLREAISSAGAEDSALNFLIPVYTDMPEEYGYLPLRTGNANNLLESITLDGGRVSSTFDRYVTEYDVYTDESTITVTAVALDEGAVIEGTGTVALVEGINEVPITVTATNGMKRTYTLYVSSTAEKDFSTEHTINENVISDIILGTDLASFKEKVTVSGYEVKFTDADGNEKKDDGVMMTGDKITLTYGGATEREILIAVKGDASGDGRLSLADLLKTQSHILGIKELEGIYYTAADYSGDGKLSLADLLQCQKIILNS
jgi:beta-N-acetylglucosaminidase